MGASKGDAGRLRGAATWPCSCLCSVTSDSAWWKDRTKGPQARPAVLMGRLRRQLLNYWTFQATRKSNINDYITERRKAWQSTLSFQKESPAYVIECHQDRASKKAPPRLRTDSAGRPPPAAFAPPLPPHFFWWRLLVNSFQLWVTNSVFCMFILTQLPLKWRIFLVE